MITGLDPARSVASPFHSQGILVQGASTLLFVAGQVGVRADGTRAEGVAEQTTVAMENVVAVLAEGAMGMDDVAKLTVHVTDHDHIPTFVERARPFLGEPRPATTLLVVAALADPTLLVQVEAVAAR